MFIHCFSHKELHLNVFFYAASSVYDVNIFFLLLIAFLSSCDFFALFDFVLFSQILGKYVNLPKYAVMHKVKKKLIFFQNLLLLHGKLCCGAVGAPALGSFFFSSVCLDKTE